MEFTHDSYYRLLKVLELDKLKKKKRLNVQITDNSYGRFSLNIQIRKVFKEVTVHPRKAL